MPDETPVVGLTDSELDRIPTMIYKNAKSDDDKCAVCLNEYIKGDQLKGLKCKHYFHSECIDPWLKVNFFKILFRNFLSILDINSMSNLSK
jgi:hypothetical protein